MSTSTLNTCTSGARPASPALGDTLYETDTKRIIVYDGAVWRIYNNDGIAYNTAGTGELHYPSGIFSSSSASYYISTNPELHFDAKYIDGADAANNPADAGSVASWSNRSGASTSYTATQSTGSATPVFTATGDGSKPTVTFDGGDYLDLANLYEPSSFSFIVVSKSDDASKVGVFGWNGAWQNTIWWKYSANSSDSVTGVYSVGDYSSPENFSMHVVTRSGTSVSFYENGGSALWTGTSSATMKLGRIGGSQLGNHDGNISEILVFDSALSTSDLNVVRNYVSNKYGITTTSF